MSIPVICDRCCAAGTAGTGDFATYGDLLDFVPVVVQPRVNGWDPDAQRAFIALLATTGSKSRAATAIGRNAYGIDQLLKRTDSESFKLAYDRALAIAKQHGSMKLAQGVADAAARNAQLAPPSRLAGVEPEEDDDSGMSYEDKHALFSNIIRKYVRKIEHEREARLDGRVVEADFTLRQITCLEIALDLSALKLGTSGWAVLQEARLDGHSIFDIAETDMSRMLDAERRAVWEANGEPERPEHPPRRYLVEHDGYSLEPTEYLRGGSKEYHEEQIAAQAKQHAEDARIQIDWERCARSGRSEDITPQASPTMDSTPLPLAGGVGGGEPYVEDEADIAMREALAAAGANPGARGGGGGAGGDEGGEKEVPLG